MLAAKHLERAGEIETTIRKFHPGQEDVAAVVELVHGAVHQYAAAFLLAHHNSHHDKHQGIPGALDQVGRKDEADEFRRLTILRAGRWYGGQGNGKVVSECLKILESFRALAYSK